MADYRVAGSYLESCNCRAICPCRRIDGTPGGRSTYGECMGVLSWLIADGNANGVELTGLAVALALRYSDDEKGSPWTYVLYVDERGDDEQRAALEEIFTGRAGGDAVDHFPWAWKPSHLVGVRTAQIEIDHTPRRGRLRVGDEVSIRISGPVPDEATVTCVIPGHDREGDELIAAELRVDAGPLSFAYEGSCAFESTFDYAG